MGKIMELTSKLSLMIVLFASLLSCSNSSEILTSESVTKVYRASPDSCFPDKNIEMLTILKKGESAKVIGRSFPKDCMVLTVELKDGRKGYVLSGKEFTLNKRNPSQAE